LSSSHLGRDRVDEVSLGMKLKGVRRLLVLGIGNEFKGDDGAGIVLARRLKRKWRSSEKLCSIDGGSTPENSISAIRRFNPSHVLLVDAANMELPPGTIRVIEKERISGLAISTHGLSLKVVAEYLEKMIGTKVIVVGIQPLRVELGKGVSRPVAASLDSLEHMISNLMEKEV
jgi:hydrogenase 3 maturation protease